MRVVDKYSHLNGEEYLLVHAKPAYDEILNAIAEIDADELRTKISKEKRTPGARLLSPQALNKAFRRILHDRLGWRPTVYSYCVTTDRQILHELVPLSYQEQRKLLQQRGVANPVRSFK